MGKKGFGGSSKRLWKDMHEIIKQSITFKNLTFQETQEKSLWDLSVFFSENYT